MYKYETHLHTSPVSKCAKAGVYESLEYYKKAGYDGVFITNHFIDGNISMSREEPFEKLINFYFSDYEEGVVIGKKLGIKVFAGVELSYKGTDFLIYGLDKEWYLDHPEIDGMEKKEELALMDRYGALIIQAHPFREASYINHIRLYPRSVHGVETINACRTDLENEMAAIYAEKYGLLPFAGTDNHSAGRRASYAGMQDETPLKDEADFVKRIKEGRMKLFTEYRPENLIK